MSDVFISYSQHDSELARFVQAELNRHGIAAFAACATLQPGDRWSSNILENLRASSWVVVLASRAAANSAYVNQEIGAALGAAKTLVPFVWDMAPTELPGWLRECHAVNLSGKTTEDLRAEVASIAGRVQQQKQKAALVVGAVVLGLLFLSSK